MSLFTYVIQFQKSILLFLFLFLIFLTPNLLKLEISSDFKVYFSEENPQLKSFLTFEDEFDTHDSAALVLHRTSGSWLTKESMELLTWIESELQQIDTVSNVFSLANYRYSYSSNDTLYIKTMSEFIQENSHQPKRINQAIENDEQLNGLWLSKDGNTTIVHGSVLLAGDKNASMFSTYEQLTNIREIVRLRNPEIEAYLAGSVLSGISLNEGVKNDMLTLVPLSYLLIAVGLFYFLRSFIATIITLIVVSISIALTFMIYGAFVKTLTPVAGFVPSVVLTLAVADCVHYLMSYRVLKSTTQLTCLEANKEAFEINWLPISITSLTTVAGVLCLNFSDSPPYRDLGNMVAIGVIVAWILSLTIVPILLNLFQLNYSFKACTKKPFLVQLFHSILNHRIKLLISTFIVVAVSLFGVTRLELTEDWSRYFSKKFEVRQTTELLRHQFNRLHKYEVVVDSGVENGINHLNYLTLLDSLSTFLGQDKRVVHSQSYDKVLKRLNQNMHNDSSEFYRLPDSQQLAAQYFLLYEISLPQGVGIPTTYNRERTSTRMTIFLSPMTSKELLDFEKDFNAYFSEKNVGGFAIQLTGMDSMFAHIAERNISSMLYGTAAAVVVISLILTFVFRSIKYGLIALMPNIFPALLAYGFWGWAHGAIDLALSVVICMSLGIIVDDTVHFISKYLQGKRRLQLSSLKAMEYTFDMVGRALITTTVILALGFSLLYFSEMTPTANTGLMLSLTLCFALLVDFIVLPLSLHYFDSEK